MPTPSSASSGPRLGRRAVLAGAAAVAAAAVQGCTVGEPLTTRRSGPGRASPSGPVEPPSDPDVLVATEALRAEEETMALLRATARRHRRLAARLQAPLRTHEAHVALLAEAVPESHAPSPTTSPSGSPAPSPAGPEARRTPVAGRRGRALRDVTEAETRLSAALEGHALAARSGAFARVLGSMAASAAQHAAALAGGAGS